MSSLVLSQALLFIDSTLEISLDEERDQLVNMMDSLAASTSAKSAIAQPERALFVDTLDDLSLPTLTTYDDELCVTAPLAKEMPCSPTAYDADCDSDDTISDVARSLHSSESEMAAN